MDEIAEMLQSRGLTETQIRFLGELLDAMRRYSVSNTSTPSVTVVNLILDKYVGKE